jgi:hypothetical protein
MNISGQAKNHLIRKKDKGKEITWSFETTHKEPLDHLCQKSTMFSWKAIVKSHRNLYKNKGMDICKLLIVVIGHQQRK